MYSKLKEDAAFFAASSLFEEVFLSTVSFTTCYTRPDSEGRVIASCKVIHSSRRLPFARAAHGNADGNPIGRGVGTFMRSHVALDEEIG